MVLNFRPGPKKGPKRAKKEAAQSDPDRLSATRGNTYGTPAATSAKVRHAADSVVSQFAGSMLSGKLSRAVPSCHGKAETTA